MPLRSVPRHGLDRRDRHILAAAAAFALAVAAGLGPVRSAVAESIAPPSPPPVLSSDATITNILFGSCSHQDKQQPLWDPILALDPQVFLYIGDNIYGDSRDMDVLRAKYAKLAAVPGFARLRAEVPILATWDDHDFGENDSGRDYPMRDESQKLFLEFFGDAPDSPRRARPGVYMDRIVGPPGRRVQFLMLDTRYFRSPIPKKPNTRLFPYLQDDSPDAEMLGEAQWKWLEERLREPAELRIVASSIQFLVDFNSVECWEEFPLEKRRMLDVIDRTRAEGVIFLSGDVHWAEIARLPREGAYPIYDLTSSGLTHVHGQSLPNGWRIEGPWKKISFGRVAIDWEAADPVVTLEVHGEGGLALSHSLHLSELRFP